jgi:hypothetical protein
MARREGRRRSEVPSRRPSSGGAGTPGTTRCRVSAAVQASASIVAVRLASDGGLAAASDSHERWERQLAQRLMMGTAGRRRGTSPRRCAWRALHAPGTSSRSRTDRERAERATSFAGFDRSNRLRRDFDEPAMARVVPGAVGSLRHQGVKSCGGIDRRHRLGYFRGHSERGIWTHRRPFRRAPGQGAHHEGRHVRCRVRGGKRPGLVGSFRGTQSWSMGDHRDDGGRRRARGRAGERAARSGRRLPSSRTAHLNRRSLAVVRRLRVPHRPITQDWSTRERVSSARPKGALVGMVCRFGHHPVAPLMVAAPEPWLAIKLDQCAALDALPRPVVRPSLPYAALSAHPHASRIQHHTRTHPVIHGRRGGSVPAGRGVSGCPFWGRRAASSRLG